MKIKPPSGSKKTNPISVKPKMSANAFSQKDYENKTALRLQKNKPNSNPVLSAACPERIRMGRMGQFQTAGKRTKEAKKKKRISGTFLRLWLDGEIDFLDGCDIILVKIMGNINLTFCGG